MGQEFEDVEEDAQEREDIDRYVVLCEISDLFGKLSDAFARLAVVGEEE